MANPRGIAALPSALIPQAAPTQPEPTTAAASDESVNTEQSSGAGEVKPRRRVRRDRVTGGETHGRKLTLPDSVFDRLQLTAIQKRKTISAIATEILDRNLPKLRITND